MSYFNNEKNEPIDREITAVFDQMDESGVLQPEYGHMLSYLERLSEVKTKSRRLRVSPDTLAVVACNLIGILMIVMYEQKHVITTKGIGQLIKPR
jgi:hypothetical protein